MLKRKPGDVCFLSIFFSELINTETKNENNINKEEKENDLNITEKTLVSNVLHQ